MFWADTDADKIQQRFSEQIASGQRIVVRDEKTASGKVHVGSLRGVAIHDLIARVLREREISAEFVFEINDFDPMDGLPSYLDAAVYQQHMGKPLKDVPSPDPSVAPNFAEYYGRDFENTIQDLQFVVSFTRLYPKYQAGEFDECIRMALKNAQSIRDIYREVSGSEKPDDWYPLQVVCEKCGKIGTTKVTGFDGISDTNDVFSGVVLYECLSDLVEWAQGCGYSGSISPYRGNAKLPWKVEWAAKWKVYGVHVEGAGKDHNASGGSREVATRIANRVFDYSDPYDIKYEHLLSGGKKMSSSKGIGATASDMATLLPTDLIRILMVGGKPQQAAEFDPSGDTVLRLFDRHDELAAHYRNEQKGERHNDFVRQFVLMHPEKEEMYEGFLPPFSQIVFLSQIPGVDLEARIQEIKGASLTQEDKEEIAHRLVYAKRWIEMAAPQEYIYELQRILPSVDITDAQRDVLRQILFAFNRGDRDDILQASVFDAIKSEDRVTSKEVFQLLYTLFLGRTSGPKIGWFLSALDPTFVRQRFEEVLRS